MSENAEIQKAQKELEKISNDERERYLAELREKYIMDQKATEDAGYDKGKKVGIAAGRKEEKIEIAKEMLKKGLDIEMICDITKLTKEEIEKL